MRCPDLGAFWSENKQRIGEALARDMEAVAAVFQAGADAFELQQTAEGRYIRWQNPEGQLFVTFAFIPDPRDVDAVVDVYVQARDKQGGLTAVFVHQWTDGEGNWDVFAIGPRRAMRHVDRIDGTDQVQQRGPRLREDIYTLFACDRDLPGAGQVDWADLLAGPVEKVAGQFAVLATEHGCAQTVTDHTVQWLNADGALEVQFFLLPAPDDLDGCIRMYERIRETRCPVSFVFVKGDEPRLYDIFRLSARSFLEHHNQIKGRLRLAETGKGKMLDGLRWRPRWASHVGCIKGCLDYLGCKVSDAWLFGATGHGFTLNISPGLCPSGPTDWDTSGFLRLGRNVGFQVESVDAYCPKEIDRRDAQERAWDHVRHSIDEGLPCYGWEMDIPEYYVIFGYDKTGYYISGPQCDEGAGPIPWRNLGTSRIGVVFVSSVRRAEPAAPRKTVRDALDYAVTIGHNRVKWTDRTGGLAGYDLWIETMEQGKAGRFGLGYNAAVWAESRKLAVEFLKEARQKLDADLHPLFDRAIAPYETVAHSLKTVSESYPFQECKDTGVKADAHAQAAIDALKQARAAEATGLDVLAELVDVLDDK